MKLNNKPWEKRIKHQHCSILTLVVSGCETLDMSPLRPCYSHCKERTFYWSSMKGLPPGLWAQRDHLSLWGRQPLKISGRKRDINWDLRQIHAAKGSRWLNLKFLKLKKKPSLVQHTGNKTVIKVMGLPNEIWD